MCSFTSGYFPIYDNEYGHIHYDDDDGDDDDGDDDDDDDDVLHDIQGFGNLWTFDCRQLARLRWAQGVCRSSGGLTLECLDHM